ncbi:N-acetyltransferase [Henriciella mobilis]|uniref:GNAT family N-acetyltransferase n=1 Tax=Henriciella mobilis TaxID=2305467 RepID=UPI000E666252|nr:GNAT family protein [Henriciella mobilis]RIJ17390.1 N-acetyltransferase [Henriciella mobilis]RIJ25621.1 N-acetyltransferase [Henriciella mobilis]
MELGAPGLETSLIRLEALGAKHRPALLECGVADDIWKLMPLIPEGNSPEAYFDYTMRMGELGTGQALAVIVRETGAFIGIAAYLYPNRLNRRVRIGYTWIDPRYRGIGMSAHINYLMLKRALEWRARRVEWMMSMRSEQAIAVMDRWGMVREGVLRAYSRMADGSWADVVVYSLIADEIRATLMRMGGEIGELEAAPGA